MSSLPRTMASNEVSGDSKSPFAICPPYERPAHLSRCVPAYPLQELTLALRTSPRPPGWPASISCFLPPGLPSGPKRPQTHPGLSHLPTCPLIVTSAPLPPSPRSSPPTPARYFLLLEAFLPPATQQGWGFVFQFPLYFPLVFKFHLSCLIPQGS